MIGTILSLLITADVPVDKAAHFGVSYALTHTCQVTLHKGLEVNHTASTVICATGTLAIGATRELLGNKDAKDMMANVAGVGLAVTFISIDW